MNSAIKKLAAGTVSFGKSLQREFARHHLLSSRPETFPDLHDAILLATAGPVSHEDLIETICQSVACVATVARLHTDVFADSKIIEWSTAHASPLFRDVLQDGLKSAESRTVSDVPDAEYASTFFFEHVLTSWSPKSRTKHGVFFTPRPIASSIIRSVDDFLRQEFGVSRGLAAIGDESALPIRVLDPAAGTGVFLLEAIGQIHENWRKDEGDGDWSEFVVDRLLPNICGVELMLPSCLIAFLSVIAKLAKTGFDFRPAGQVEIHLSNSLAGPNDESTLFDSQESPRIRSARHARALTKRWPATVVVGNPPFSGISRQKHQWIENLVKGRSDGAKDLCNYFLVDGEPLGERKHWLDDDYVKFVRLAHWKIESAGAGILGMVTNHGYMDNPSFRGMRWQLMDTFSEITLLDLHGNRRKGEQAPDGAIDENVFAIDQGTAIGLFRKQPRANGNAIIRHGDVWGSTAQKLRAIQNQSTSINTLEPNSPDFLFIPRDEQLLGEYESGLRLPDVMPVNVTAPVTARDLLVVAFDRLELIARLDEFRDLSISDDEIRTRLMGNTRSTKYPAGDTRGWKLAEARRRMAADEQWQTHITKCWYRPFDQRVVYWTDWMVDWPRSDVTQDLVADGNLAIIARRQMLPTQPCNYFWITDQLALDGIIRSDNRGSESLFPLYVQKESRREANYSQDAIRAISEYLGEYRIAKSQTNPSWSANEFFHYAYGIFFSTEYRQRYAPFLRSGFPRIPLPRCQRFFAEMRQLGERLVSAHLMQSQILESTPTICTRDSESPHEKLGSGCPKFQDQSIQVNSNVSISPVSKAAWEFRVGGHQVLRKWLRDRRHRIVRNNDLKEYCQVIAHVTESIRIREQVDSIVARFGLPQD